MASGAPAARDRKRHGRHYTPPELARFLAGRLLTHVPPPETGVLRVLDPACGDGELLFALRDEAAIRLPGVQVELTGYDLDAAALAVARSRTAGGGVDWQVGDFLTAAEELPEGSFDAVITNPPYVRTQQLGGETAQLLSKQYGLRGRIDLTHPFVATLPRLLCAGGVLGLLCANRFLTTKAGANIRRLLLAELTPVELYDLGDTKLFEAAVLPAITIATRGQRGGECRYVSAYEVENGRITSPTDLFEALTGERGCLVAHRGRTFAIEVGTLVTGHATRSAREATAAPEISAQDCADYSDELSVDLQATEARRADGPRANPGTEGRAQSVEPRGSSGAEGRALSAGPRASPGAEGRLPPDEVRMNPRTDGPSRPDGSRAALGTEGPTRPDGASSTLWAGRSTRSDGATSNVPTEGLRPSGSTRARQSPPEKPPKRGGRRKSLPRNAEPETAWRMSNAEVDSWLSGIAATTWRSFGEVARIRVGIKTTADKVFISDRWSDVEPPPEPELLRELITHHDLEPWRIARAHDTRVLYPYDLTRPNRTPIDLNEFPCAAEYLRTHKDTLAARHYLAPSGREWFEIWVPQRPHLWREPKLVFPDISDRPRFALDRSGAVVNGDCYWISLPDLATNPADAERLAYLLMGVANSALGLRFYDAVCGNRLYSGRRRWITQYVSRLPLPNPGSAGSAAIVELAREFVAGRLPDVAARAELDERVATAFSVSLPVL
ncbi:Eco57I restriction-modification methylase domain-containing protein [Nocardia colli]|uniref:Eco57I restriction-modification methylase domain-containing protein n=1 Tax=Nocardia colli TaxID=2545717 RepID=UPI0035DB7C67